MAEVVEASSLFRCPHCDKVFPSVAALGEHTAAQGGKPHACCLCRQPFSCKHHLQSHILSHATVPAKRPKDTPSLKKSFQCSECGKDFQSNISLKYHMMLHTGDKPQQCPICDKKFLLLSQVNAHMMTHMGANDKDQHQCPECDKLFINNSKLTRHMMTHTGEKPYKCSECGQEFSRSGHLKRHIETRAHPKIFKCEECGEQFKTPFRLRCHVAHHAHLRKLKEAQRDPSGLYKCSQCNKHFLQAEHMKAHKLTHQQERHVIKEQDVKLGQGQPYMKPMVHGLQQGRAVKPGQLNSNKKATTHKSQEGVIGAPGQRQANMKGLAMTHGEEDLYKCGVCNKYFIQLDHLKAHELTHTEPEHHGAITVQEQSNVQVQSIAWSKQGRYKCGLCNACFTDIEHLQEHEVLHRLPQLSSAIPAQEQPDSKSQPIAQSEQGLYKCDMCNKCFTQIEHLQKHELTHEQPRHNAIDRKPQGHQAKFPRQHDGPRPKIPRQYVREQAMVQQQQKLLKCRNTHFAQASHLREDELTHIQQDEQYHCVLCGMVYNNKKLLDAHMMTHPETAIMYPCSYCGQRFDNLVRFKEHIVIHTGQNYSSCDTCVRGFRQQEDLNNHLSTHAIIPMLMKDRTDKSWI